VPVSVTQNAEFYLAEGAVGCQALFSALFPAQPLMALFEGQQPLFGRQALAA